MLAIAFRRSCAAVLLCVSLSLGLASAATPLASKSPPASATIERPTGTVVNPPAAPVDFTRDYHTQANTDEFRVRHLELDLAADFDARQLSGTAELTLDRVSPAASRVVLDTDGLTIRQAWFVDGAKRVSIPHELGPAHAMLGRALTLPLPESAAGRSSVVVRIEYSTSPDAQGLQWLTPAQTAGRKHPFLFSQSQSIYARTWIPLQDSPQVRFTFRARIATPKALRGVMGASNDPAAPLDGTFEFEMPQPIPSYLMAIAIGDLVFRPTGPRTGIYAEPPVVEKAAREFADTERMVQAGERLFGPYRWGRYDLLILPPSFPYGGMENPRLTFATPTVIAGDRSLVALVAHELAHSWSGNLVTNATWRDFWLNEGFTTFAESKIVGALYGADRRAQEDSLGAQTLQRALAEMEARDEVLAIDLRNRHAEDSFSDIPYEKGRHFLVWLESRVGEAAFMAWLRRYFDHFAFQSLTTETFVDYLRDTLHREHPAAFTMDEVRRWIYEPGVPASIVYASSDAFAKVDAERARFLAGTPAAQLATRGWTTQQWQHFLDNLPPRLSSVQLADLDATFGFTASGNAEIEFSWLRNAVRNRYEPAYGRLEEYLVTIGRRKLIKPLYEDLMASDSAENRAFAQRVYAKARAGYHPIAQAAIDPVLAGEK
jgi:aminopeptidase N